MNTEAAQRLRITFGKRGALQYTGNLDIAKIWERALRRAGLPVLYSRGFTSRPRLQFATATPLGITSECELLDVWLREAVSPEEVPPRLRAVSPADLEIHGARAVPVRSPSLPTLVCAAEYRVHFPDGLPAGALAERVVALLTAEVLPLRQEKKKKRGTVQISERDARPLLLELSADGDDTLRAHLATGERGNLRLRDLLQLLGLSDEFHQSHRLALILDEGGN